VQLGQLMGVAVIGSLYLSHANPSHAPHATQARVILTQHAAASSAMSATAYCLAAVSALALTAAAAMLRAAPQPSA
jgi:hypothetical protein